MVFLINKIMINIFDIKVFLYISLGHFFRIKSKRCYYCTEGGIRQDMTARITRLVSGQEKSHGKSRIVRMYECGLSLWTYPNA